MGKSKDLATGAAYQDQTESDARYANVTGDTFTDTITIKKAHSANYGSFAPLIELNGHYPGYDETAVRGYIEGGVPDQGNTTYGSFGVSLKGADGMQRRLAIDSVGRVTMPHQPHIFGTVGNTSGHSLGAAGTCNRMAVSTSGGGMTFSNSRITVPVAGVYFISWQTITSSQGSGRYDTNIRLNGSNISNGLNNASDASNDYRMRTHILARDLSANDYLQFYHNNPYADGASFNDWSIVSVFLLG